MKIDSIDCKIIGLLQRDATLAIQEIGTRVGLSANPCWRRIKLLEENGVIERRVAVIDPRAVGLRLTAFVSIRTTDHNAAWLQDFAMAVQGIPEIVECHRMSGDVDYLLKILVADMDDYDRVYRKLIARVPGLADVSSAFSMESLKEVSAIEVSPGEIRP